MFVWEAGRDVFHPGLHENVTTGMISPGQFAKSASACSHDKNCPAFAGIPVECLLLVRL